MVTIQSVRKPDLVTSLFLGFVLLCGITYTGLGLTPSSYGFMLSQIGAPEEGPVLGTARAIRFDEWAVATPLFQAAVRNGFRRINETSFYREDLRNFYLLPIKDWSLIFKPELWAFFLVPPAPAFSFYYVLLMWAFLVGYFLFFRQMALDPFVSASATVLLYFSGFTQFWWTSFGGLFAGLPWILMIFFATQRWWVKALLFSWVLPVVCFTLVYPTYVAEFAFAGIILTAALRPALFRSPGDLAALAIGGLLTGVVLYVYFAGLLPIMSHTWYPAKRVGLPGTTPGPVVLSQLFPFLTFSLQGYRQFAGSNLCESGTVASFLPLLTLCLFTPRSLWGNRPLRNGLIVILSAIALILVWQTMPAPRWIGHLLLWDHGNAERLLFISGFLLTVACLLVWRDQLLAPTPLRIVLFLLAGPLLSVALKMAIFHLAWRECLYDFALAALGVTGGAIACLIPSTQRLPLLLGTIALMNVYAFGRFNPLQAAQPIFATPETDTVIRLRQLEASTPGHFLLEPGYYGATLNGLGLRSVGHTLMAPDLALFRKYFPNMDATRFDFVFNRYAHVELTNDPLPQTRDLFVITIPIEAFQPVRNVRSTILQVKPQKDCSVQRGGAIEHVTRQGNGLSIEGWAPWKGEDPNQELLVTSARTLHADSLATVKRPDISEAMTDYAYTRSGFQLQLSSTDGRPLLPDDVVVVARGTSQGLAQIPGCGCPASLLRQ